MSRGLVLAVLVVVACSSKREPARDQPPAPKPLTVPKPPAWQPPASLPAGQHLGFVPDGIAARVGHPQGIIAIDLRAFKLDPLLALIPDPFACTRDLLKYMGVVVVAGPPIVVYATQLSEIGTKQCLDEIAPLIGARSGPARDGSYTIGADGEGASLRWDSGVLTAHELGTPAPAPEPADAELLELMNHVPPQAPGFVLVKGDAAHTVKSLVAWFRIDSHALYLSSRVEGTTAGAARGKIRDFIEGFKEGAAKKHIAVDESWFKETDTDRVSTVESRIPLSAIGAGRK